jgi:threonine dehydrogenase-like Zn-dependent dehydrogenase
MYAGKAVGLEFPRFIGHEVGGIVTAVGKEAKNIRVNDHVALYAEGKGYAEYVAVKENVAVKLRSDTPFDLALGEPIACAANGVRKADPQLNDSICLVGCGFMGLIMLQIFKARGAGLLIVVDPRESMLTLAKELGATHAINPVGTEVVKTVKELTGGSGVDIGVETGGNQQTLDIVGGVVRMEGKLEVFGFHQGLPRTVPWGFWNWMAYQIINGHSRSTYLYMEGMRIGLGLLESQKISMEPLVTHRFQLPEINRGFEMASAKHNDFVKGVIVF